VEQTRKYMSALEKCIENLAQGVGRFKELEGLQSGMRMVHCKHHYIFGLMCPNAAMLVVARNAREDGRDPASPEAPGLIFRITLCTFEEEEAIDIAVVQQLGVPVGEGGKQ